MNVQASIQVNADPVKTLECAYETLLSMLKNKPFPEELSRIDKKLLFASVGGKFKSMGPLFSRFSTLITIKKTNDTLCDLTIVVTNHGDTRTANGSEIALVSNFFELLSQNLDL